MSDKEFVDVGDELVVRIGGYPVGKARVYYVRDGKAYLAVEGHAISGGGVASFTLPLDFKDHGDVDGVAHEPVPFDGKQSSVRIER